jgi:hypothetical protein
VLAAALTWSGLGLIAGMLIANATIISTLLSFFIPSLAIYQIALETWTGQQRVATERQRLNQAATTNSELGSLDRSATPTGAGSGKQRGTSRTGSCAPGLT